MNYSTRTFDWLAFILGFLLGGLFIGVIIAIIIFPDVLKGFGFFIGGLLVGLLLTGIFWIFEHQKSQLYKVSNFDSKNNSDSGSLSPQNQPQPDTLNDFDLDVLTTIKDRGSITQSDLARILDVPRSTISEKLTELEEKGLVYREKRGRTYEIRSNWR